MIDNLPVKFFCHPCPMIGVIYSRCRIASTRVACVEFAAFIGGTVVTIGTVDFLTTMTTICGTIHNLLP
jgi:hypothetical protein